ncbi:MAG: SDR family oxidoreductase [Lentisphaeria bacterium]
MPDQPTLFITGAAKRIGAAIARSFAQKGWRVIIHYHHSRQEAETLQRELQHYSPGHFIIQADLTDTNQREKLLPDILTRISHLDCLINNASTYHRGMLGEQSLIDIKKDYQLNFFAPFALMQQYHQLCKTGQIINILDQRIYKTDPASGAYALAKKSLRDATESSALEWAPDFRVNAVAPGLILPPRGETPEAVAKMNILAKRIPMQKPTTKEEIASCCFFLAEASSITGEILCVDGGMHLQQSDYQEK